MASKRPSGDWTELQMSELLERSRTEALPSNVTFSSALSDGLLSCVQIDAYNFHLGLLRSEQCLVRAPTFYSARREADFVMTSG